MLLQLLNSAGELFYRPGTAELKVQSPQVLLMVLGTLSSLWEPDTATVQISTE